MKCRFCQRDLVSKKLDWAGGTIFIGCDAHRPVRVGYKTFKGDDKWTVSIKEYRLVYWRGKTILQKSHPEAQSAKDYFEAVKVFDYELPFAPEEFPGKLKTILTFL